MPETNDKPRKPANWLESLNCAIEGVIYAFKTQRHVRYHYVIATAALLASLFLRLTLIEFVLFALAVIILLAAEMFNTAIEETVNLVEEKHHILAKNAKDVSAGAVLISAFGVAIMVYVIFYRYLYDPIAVGLMEGKNFLAHIGVIALLIVLIAVIAMKAYGKKGRPLHGGLPSGHSAVSFSFWTFITLSTLDPLVSILTFIMAIMVSHSRLLAGVHTKLEVFLGALTGIGLTSVIFYIFSIMLK